MNKIVLIAVIVVVVIIAVVVAVPLILGHSSSCSYITPSEAASVIGGTWTLQRDESYCFNVSNGIATVKFFNGKTEVTNNLGTLGGSSSFGYYSQYTPTNGMSEFLTGTVNGESASIQANYATFPSSNIAKKFFSSEYMALRLFFNVQNVSNNEFIASALSMGSVIYTVVKLSGNTVYVVQVTVPEQLSTSQLTTLVDYL